jgi:catechol 2,3-dioxygenase-like lactoylglutathione lyase family enzyme
MSLRIECLTIDCADPDRLADFWAAALGWQRVYQDDYEVAIRDLAAGDAAGPDLLLLAVPDGKATKNRLHLDLRPDDQEAEVTRLESLGARRADIGQAGDESWVVMADPEGNEFCVLRVLGPGDSVYEGDVGQPPQG